MENNRIAAIGEGGSNPPPGLPVTDATGRRMIQGLMHADAHYQGALCRGAVSRETVLASFHAAATAISGARLMDDLSPCA